MHHHKLIERSKKISKRSFKVEKIAKGLYEEKLRQEEWAIKVEASQLKDV